MYAHASGFSWDEGLLLFAPIVVIIGSFFWVRRRDSRRNRDSAPDDNQP